MSQYRRKSMVIDAELWDGANRDAVVALAATAAEPFKSIQYHGGVLRIPTLEGVMEAQPGDWVVRGPKGELYICKPDIFADIYEVVV